MTRALKVGLLALALCALTVAAFWVPLQHFLLYSLQHDWLYFDAFATFAASSVLHYGVLPTHDPWICGGLDAIANPQHRFFSPLALLYLILPVPAAHWMAFVILAFSGIYGFYTLQLKLGRTPTTALLTGFSFIASSWFAMHWIAGHIAFATLLLLPWFLKFGLEGPNRKALCKIGLLTVFCAWDGGNYTVVFGAYTVLSAWWWMWRTNGKFEVNRNDLLAIGTLTGLGILAKILPSLAIGTGSIHHFVHDPMNIATVLQSFFNPFQRFDDPSPRVNISFHEMSAYIGWGFALVVFYAGIFRKRFFAQWKSSTRFWILFGFWFWTATGWLWPLNPWALHVLIPGLHVVHSENRLLLLMLLFFFVAVAPLLDGIQKILPRAVWVPVLLACGLEIFFVSRAVYLDAYAKFARPFDQRLIKSQTVETTIAEEEKFYHYFQSPNTGTQNCYEPAWLHRNTLASNNPQYRGEAYAADGAGTVTIDHYTPGKLEFSYRLSKPGEIEFNTNHLLGWSSNSRDLEVISHTVKDRLRVRTSQAKGQAILKYRAWTWKWQALFAFVSLMGFVILENHNRPQLSRKVLDPT